MNRLNAMLLGAAVAGAPGAALAGHDRDWEYATVVSATPVVRQVRTSVPHEECREAPVTERTVYRGYHDPGAILVGGIIGGVIGHQFGKGRGKDLATAAGAVIGASHAAHHYGRPGHVEERTVYQTTCRTVYETRFEDRVEGYDVTYRYRGRLYHTRTAYDPGRRIRVRVDVTPVTYR